MGHVRASEQWVHGARMSPRQKPKLVANRERSTAVHGASNETTTSIGAYIHSSPLTAGGLLFAVIVHLPHASVRLVLLRYCYVPCRCLLVDTQPLSDIFVCLARPFPLVPGPCSCLLPLKCCMLLRRQRFFETRLLFLFQKMVVLSPEPPTQRINTLLEHPRYRGRVKYVQVSLSSCVCVHGLFLVGVCVSMILILCVRVRELRCAFWEHRR